MYKEKIKVAAAPLYLAFYDEIDSDLRNRLAPMTDSVISQIKSFANVEVLPVITLKNDAELLLKEASKEDIDAVVTIHMSYSPSLLVADVLKSINKPILVVDTTSEAGFKSIDGDYLLKNHGIHGVMDMCSVLGAKGVFYRVCAGYHKNADFSKKLERELKLLLAAARFKNQSVGKTGEKFYLMGDFDVPYDFLEKKFGHEVVDIEESLILEYMNSVSAADVDAEYAAEKEKYGFSGEEESLKINIRQYLALKELFSEKGITAYTMNFGDFNDSPSPFYAICRLMAEGFGYAGEGDVLTASLGAAMNTIGTASFSEIFCPDWERDLLIFSHMGETDNRFAKRGGKITLREKSALGKTLKSYYYEYEAEPGTATVVTWAQTENGVKLITACVDIADYPVIDEFGAPHFVVKTPVPLAGFLEGYSNAGGGHHLYIIKGDVRADIEAFCGIIGVKYAAV